MARIALENLCSVKRLTPLTLLGNSQPGQWRSVVTLATGSALAPTANHATVSVVMPTSNLATGSAVNHLATDSALMSTSHLVTGSALAPIDHLASVHLPHPILCLTLPQALQWCLLLKAENSTRQSVFMQRETSESLTHLGARCPMSSASESSLT